MKLSLCLAVFNEEKNLHYPLDSAIDLVDEVVVVDGGSTDKTVEKALSYGKKVQVIRTNNPKMFHQNKQKAIEAAKGDWILQLDADEALSNELKQEIRAIIFSDKQKNNQKKFRVQTGEEKDLVEINAFWLSRKNWFLGRFLTKGGVYPDQTIRLYRRGTAYFPCQDVHENVEVVGGPEKTAYLKNPLLHYADPNFSRYLIRWDRYTSLEVEKMKSEGVKKIGFFSYFFWQPIKTFFLMYFRHLGFIDGFSGFVFALFSALRFWVIYIKFKTETTSS